MRRALGPALVLLSPWALAGCLFGRSYGPEEYDVLACADARCSSRGLATQPRGRDGSLPHDACQAFCSTGHTGEVRECHVATSAIQPKPLPRRLAWTFKKKVQPVGGGYWPDNDEWEPLPEGTSLAGMDPEHLDPTVCQHAYEHRFSPKPAPAEVLDQNFIDQCRLLPPPPEPGTELVECHMLIPGGVDLIPR